MKNYKLKILITEGDTELEKTISLQAGNPSELSQKINAFKILSESISHDDLIATVELIHEKPELISVIKNMIDESENLTETQMMVRLPKYVKRVLNVLKG